MGRHMLFMMVAGGAGTLGLRLKDCSLQKTACNLSGVRESVMGKRKHTVLRDPTCQQRSSLIRSPVLHLEMA